MYSITCDRCGEPDVVDAPESREIRFAGQSARLCTPCCAELRAFLAGQEPPPHAPATPEYSLEPAAG